MKDNFIIKLKPYPFYIMVSLGEKQKELSKALKKQKVNCNKECVKVPGSAGYFMPFSNSVLLIRAKAFPTSPTAMGILQHEILHCVFYIMKMVGIKLGDKSEEAYTYLHEHITEEVLKRIKKNEKRKNR